MHTPRKLLVGFVVMMILGVMSVSAQSDIVIDFYCL